MENVACSLPPSLAYTLLAFLNTQGHLPRYVTTSNRLGPSVSIKVQENLIHNSFQLSPSSQIISACLKLAIKSTQNT